MQRNNLLKGTVARIGLLNTIFGVIAFSFVGYVFYTLGYYLYFGVDDYNDQLRYSALNRVNKNIAEAVELNPDTLLCRQSRSCVGYSSLNTPKNLNFDGSGWVSVDLRPVFERASYNAMPDSLPIDPINNDEFHYTYCSNGIDWEINAKFETKKYKKEYSIEDGGDSEERFELGSDLTICP